MIKKIREIAQYYGYDSQTRQAIEELAELIQAISKHIRFFGNTRLSKSAPCEERNRVIEEMADVTIMLIQIKELLGITDDDINREMTRKVHRQEERIFKSK